MVLSGECINESSFIRNGIKMHTTVIWQIWKKAWQRKSQVFDIGLIGVVLVVAVVAALMMAGSFILGRMQRYDRMCNRKIGQRL